MASITSTNLEDIPVFRRGKVRDVYNLGNALLIVATDRISAFDVIMNEGVPNKGALLTGISMFWFEQTKNLVPNHVLSTNPSDYPEVCRKYADLLEGRSMLVKKTRPIPVECVVRGYLAGSGLKEYREKSSVCGVALPPGLQEASQLPEPIFTPTTKADSGHDQALEFHQAVEIIGEETAEKVRSLSLVLFKFASAFLDVRGLILADTKFEFGFDDEGQVILIDEALTPDSSRFWNKEGYRPGQKQHQFDKQVLRDYLETLEWNKQYPAPELPLEIIGQTESVYRDIYRRILAKDF